MLHAPSKLKIEPLRRVLRPTKIENPEKHNVVTKMRRDSTGSPSLYRTVCTYVVYVRS